MMCNCRDTCIQTPAMRKTASQPEKKTDRNVSYADKEQKPIDGQDNNRQINTDMVGINESSKEQETDSQPLKCTETHTDGLGLTDGRIGRDTDKTWQAGRRQLNRACLAAVD